MRGGPWSQLATPLYGFFSRMFQNSYRIAWESKDAFKAIKGGDVKTGMKAIPHIMSGIWSFVIFPALVEQMVTPIMFPQGTSDSKKMAEVLARGTASQVPIIRDMVDAYLGGHDPAVGLYSGHLKSISDFARDMNKGEFGMDRQHFGKTWKDFNVVLGMLTGMTNAQIGKTGEFIYNYTAGLEHPKSIIPLTDNNWIDGLSRGTLRKPR